MIKIRDTRRNNDTDTKGIVEAIVRDARCGSGQIEKIESDVLLLVGMIQFVLEKMPEEQQADFINKFSWRFKAELTT